jgi:F420-non-reducing hydrogenase iron-sulfur subunit
MVRTKEKKAKSKMTKKSTKLNLAKRANVANKPNNVNKVNEVIKPKFKIKISKTDKKKSKIINRNNFEPRILAFCCNWCSYAGADLAGVSRIQYPTNVRILRVMCSGRIEPGHIFSAFEAGADGVIISGCHPGDCHYISGNLRAEEMITKMKKLFNIIGFDERRLRLQWVSASEGQLFAEYISEFVDLIKSLGPNTLKNDQKLTKTDQKNYNLQRKDSGVVVE